MVRTLYKKLKLTDDRNKSQVKQIERKTCGCRTPGTKSTTKVIVIGQYGKMDENFITSV